MASSDLHKPAISILVPIYNVERYLEQCLSSIRSQDFADYEVICINDGSTDSSADIIKQFMSIDSRFKIIDKRNTGYGDSMNKGLEAAKGEYVTILESDDFYELYALNKLYNCAIENDCDVVKADFNLYWSDDDRRIKFGVIPRGQGRKVIDPSKSQEILLKKNSIWSGLYRREFLINNDISFLATPGASYQDTSFSFKVFACAKSAYFLDFPVLNYRQDNEASSVNSPGKVKCIIDEYSEIENFLNDRSLFDIFCYSFYVSMLNAYLWNYDRLSKDLKPGFLELMRDDFQYRGLMSELLKDKRLPLWSSIIFKAVCDNPDKFMEAREKLLTKGKLGTVDFYLSLGGFVNGTKACIEIWRKGQY